MLSAYDFARGPVQQIVIKAVSGDAIAGKMMGKVQELYLPRRVLLCSIGEGDGRLRELCPYLADKTAVEGKTAAYVCRNYSCQAPVTSVEELLQQLTGDR
jgi:uncharacterized protein